jgi:hypothetical protein
MLVRRTMLLVLVSAALTATAAWPHNNPSFDKVVIAEIPVDASSGPDGAQSEPFTLELPEKTIQLHYEVVADDPSAVRFSLASGGEIVAADLQHAGRSKPLKTGPLTVVEASGAGAPFTIRILAETIVR